MRRFIGIIAVLTGLVLLLFWGMSVYEAYTFVPPPTWPLSAINDRLPRFWADTDNWLFLIVGIVFTILGFFIGAGSDPSSSSRFVVVSSITAMYVFCGIVLIYFLLVYLWFAGLL